MPRVLHAREYGAEGQLNLIIELVQLALLKFGGKGLKQRIDGAGIDVERRLGSAVSPSIEKASGSKCFGSASVWWK